MVYRQLVTDKEEQAKVNAIAIVSAVLGLIWLFTLDHIAYVPAGKIIDDAFLNTFKWMIFWKYLLAFLLVSMIFIPTIVSGFKKESSRNRKIIVLIISITVLILGGLIALRFDDVRRGLFETPSVSEHIVEKKYYSKRGKTHNLYFEDESFAHVSSYQYGKISSDDTVYVVYVADVAIGAFRAEEYSLAVS